MTVIIIVAIIGLYIYWKMSTYNNSEWVKKLIEGRNDEIKYDILDELLSIIPLSPNESVLKKDVALALDIERKIAELRKIESWHSYLSKVGLYKDYKTLINYKV